MNLKSCTLILILIPSILCSQTNQLDAYKHFLEANKNMSVSGLQSMYDAGSFRSRSSNHSDYLYLDSIGIKYGLTDYEKQLLSQHGFMVTERIPGYSFAQSFLNIYHKDLPVYVSSDAILHAFHVSYDQILKEVEVGMLIDKLTGMLTALKNGIPIMETKYAGIPGAEENLKDIDLYLSVPLRLLNLTESPYYSGNNEEFSLLLTYINELQLNEIPFFSSVTRKIDFSQFKIRGHYEDEHFPELGRYFQAMIWLGRMELYLIAPQTAQNKPTREDVQRQTINSFLLTELIEETNQRGVYNEIESILVAFVGDQDNVKLENLTEIKNEINLSNPYELTDTLKFIEFQNKLAEKSYAFQSILSQVLMSDPASPDSIRPASAFMLFGQRFVIDSYVTGNVVFDKIKSEGESVKRMLPSTLDILFALGNDAAAQLLTDELEKYKYSSNLAGLRYLIDGHDETFWNKSIYNSWLNSLRALNPPADRENLPSFMQTAAWWQHKMNTQLAGWAELRHDNLLYAKQSYTGGEVCSYPYSFVEPVPEFFRRMSKLASTVSEKISAVNFSNNNFKERIDNFFNRFRNITDTLETIATKELTGVPFSENEKYFLRCMLSDDPYMCGGSYDGWYSDLYFPINYEDGLLKEDRVVVDYHTAPTDEFGATVGWVKHAGTGYVNMAVITTSLPGGENVAFIGPVMSYHEYTTTNFRRLSDSEWKDEYLELSARPDWVNIFIADREGKTPGPGLQLITGIENDNTDFSIPESFILASNYPNPFNNGTIINYTVPSSLANQMAELTIYDYLGQKVTTLVKSILPSGNYFTRWSGKDESGNSVASGIYFYSLKIGGERYIGKMNLLK